jgi:hypothetical protein
MRLAEHENEGENEELIIEVDFGRSVSCSA